jgi:hypothetical protein
MAVPERWCKRHGLDLQGGRRMIGRQEGSSMRADADSMLDTIAALALQIAQSCPDCADAAGRISDLAGEIRGALVDPDQGAVRDAVEAGAVDSDMSDARVDATVDAVVKMRRE